MLLYRQASENAQSEIIIEKSRFISHVRPVESREEADGFFAEIRKKYRDATHNVPAMVLGDKMQVQWASDDGEPQGTSGAPMVQLLTSMGVTNTALIVTRYFGGIKLGTGGLVRAYTQAAQAALSASGISEIREMISYIVKLDYSLLSKMTQNEGKYGYQVKNIIYEDKVTLELLCEPEKLDILKGFVSDISGGKAEILGEEKGIEKIAIAD